MNKVGNQEMVRATNQKLILNLIKEKKAISRAEIAKTLSLSPPSTSSNIDRLLKMNVILETGEGESIGGRRPILLELNRQYGYIISVDMGNDEVKVCLGSIYAEIIDSTYFKMRDDGEGVAFLLDLINAINSLLKRNNVGKDKVKIIVAAAVGVYDNSEASNINSWPSWLNTINITGVLGMEFKAKVLLKNYVNAAAFGEYKYGITQKCSNLVYVNADKSIGAGLIINGGLYEGSFGASGIISSTAFSKEHIGGIYKRQGYLETVVSTSRLIQRIRNTCKNDSMILELCGNDIRRLDFGVLKRAYEKNHMTVKAELDRVVDLIAITIANINSLLNLDMIVLGGMMALLGEYYILSVKRIISEVCPFTPYIVYSTLKDNSATYGALALGQQYILEELL